MLQTKRIGAATGIAAPVLALTCILCAIATYPAFNWVNNALSDLGVVPGVTSVLFNFGLCTGGFLAFAFSTLGLFAYAGKSWVGKLGALVFAAATVALIAIGVFNENFKGTHYAVSVAFFALAPISLFLLTGAFVLAHRRGLAIFTLAVAFAAALPWVLQFTYNYVPNVAVPEILSGVFVAVWVMVLSVKMLRA